MCKSECIWFEVQAGKTTVIQAAVVMQMIKHAISRLGGMLPVTFEWPEDKKLHSHKNSMRNFVLHKAQTQALCALWVCLTHSLGTTYGDYAVM